MDFMDYSAISFGSQSDIELVCERLTDIIGAGSWFVSFTVKNTTWLSAVRKIITAMNSDSVLCEAFGLYPSYVAGILYVVEEIHFYVLCNDTIICAEYPEQEVSNEECTISSVSCDKNYFKLSSNGETVMLKFEAIISLTTHAPHVAHYTDTDPDTDTNTDTDTDSDTATYTVTNIDTDTDTNTDINL
jgi:hypothetical protein